MGNIYERWAFEDIHRCFLSISIITAHDQLQGVRFVEEDERWRNGKPNSLIMIRITGPRCAAAYCYVVVDSGIIEQTQVIGLNPLLESKLVIKQVQTGILEREVNIIPGIKSNVSLTRVRGAERSIVVLLIRPLHGGAPIFIEYRADADRGARGVRMRTGTGFHIPIISTEPQSSLRIPKKLSANLVPLKCDVGVAACAFLVKIGVLRKKSRMFSDSLEFQRLI